MTKAEPIGLPEVLNKLYDKLDEAVDFLNEMEKTKEDARLFRHRTSAFLSAAGSVIMIMETHTKRYAKQIGKEPKFQDWYEAEKDAFRMLKEARKSKKRRSEGTDNVWKYLQAARHDTIHIESTNLHHLARHDISALIRLRSEFEAEEHHEDGSATVVGTAPESSLPPEPSTSHVEKDLWSFKPIQIVDKGDNIVESINPPPDDVVSVCNAHLDKLLALIKRCEDKLMELTLSATPTLRM